MKEIGPSIPAIASGCSRRPVLMFPSVASGRGLTLSLSRGGRGAERRGRRRLERLVGPHWNHLDHSARRRSTWVPGIRCPGPFNEKHVRLLLRDRTVLCTLRHYEEFTGTDGYVAVTQLDRNASFQHQEEIISVVVLVPHELSLELDHPQVVPVELTDRSRLPILGKHGELFREIDALHGSHLNARPVTPNAMAMSRRSTNARDEHPRSAA